MRRRGLRATRAESLRSVCGRTTVLPTTPPAARAARVETGDRIGILPRSIRLAVSDEDQHRRREATEARGDEAWPPTGRTRRVTPALQAYGQLDPTTVGK